MKAAPVSLLSVCCPLMIAEMESVVEEAVEGQGACSYSTSVTRTEIILSFATMEGRSSVPVLILPKTV